jgi:hypothetical protein
MNAAPDRRPGERFSDIFQQQFRQQFGDGETQLIPTPESKSAADVARVEEFLKLFSALGGQSAMDRVIRLLSVLEKAGEPVTLFELRTRSGLAEPEAKTSLDSLTKQGLVLQERTRSGAEVLSLTGPGRLLLGRFRPAPPSRS